LQTPSSYEESIGNNYKTVTTDYNKYEREFEVQNIKLSESENESDDSPIYEHRIRRAADFADEDVANEGNKSTYLRPSQVNKSTAHLNKSSLPKENNNNNNNNSSTVGSKKTKQQQ
jgi:hypothetical protein